MELPAASVATAGTSYPRSFRPSAPEIVEVRRAEPASDQGVESSGRRWPARSHPHCMSSPGGSATSPRRQDSGRGPSRFRSANVSTSTRVKRPPMVAFTAPRSSRRWSPRPERTDRWSGIASRSDTTRASIDRTRDGIRLITACVDVLVVDLPAEDDGLTTGRWSPACAA